MKRSRLTYVSDTAVPDGNCATHVHVARPAFAWPALPDLPRRYAHNAECCRSSANQSWIASASHQIHPSSRAVVVSGQHEDLVDWC